MTAKEEEKRRKQQVEEAATRRRREREQREKITHVDRPSKGTGDGGAHLRDQSKYPNKKPGI